MSAGEKNAYWCPACRGYIVTIDRDEGTTPMFLACRVKGEPGPDNPCDGIMRSMIYPEEPWGATTGYGHEIPTEPTWEWYAPTGVELKRLQKKARQRGGADADTLDYVQRGGLLLRRIGDV